MLVEVVTINIRSFSVNTGLSFLDLPLLWFPAYPAFVSLSLHWSFFSSRACGSSQLLSPLVLECPMLSPWGFSFSVHAKAFGDLNLIHGSQICICNSDHSSRLRASCLLGISTECLKVIQNFLMCKN
jgi:hypothetical protein